MSEKIYAFKSTIPIMLGYIAIGTAFGLIIQNAGYPWYIALLMSITIYAGAGQYAAANMYAVGASFFDIGMAALLINSRHSVYGLSLLEKYKGTWPFKPYLIFGLTDETFGVVSVTKVYEGMDKKKLYLYITLLDQVYWISGGMIGYFLGANIPFDFTGVDFALTSLFVVLLLEQWRNCKNKIPFVIAGVCALAVLPVAGSKHMLIAAFVTTLLALAIFKKKVEKCYQ